MFWGDQASVSVCKPSSQSAQIINGEKFTASKFFRCSKLLYLSCVSPHSPREVLHCCASEAARETEGMVQHWGMD